MKEKQQKQLVVTEQEPILAPSSVAASIEEAIAKFPSDKFNLVLPLRAPRTPEKYELWCAAVKITQADCAQLPGNKFMPLKHKLLEIAREAGVIVEKVEQILPSTWRPIVELARQLHALPHAQHLSREWIFHELQTILHHRRNDVAVRVSVLLEVAPGEYVRAVGTAEWIEEDERALIERAVRRKEDSLSEELINQKIEDHLLDVRRFRVRIAETKALLRAIRAVLSLKTAYTPEELAKPFIVVSWRRIKSDEEIMERWREVFGDYDEHTVSASAKVVEVVEEDSNNTDETVTAVSNDEPDVVPGIWLE